MAVYSKRYPFCAEEGSGLTLLEAERAFQLLPDPPKVENLNDYIVMAVNGNENGFPFFLHAYEERLNRRIRGFLLREGFRNTEPDRLTSLDEYKAIRKAGRLYRENHEKTREAVRAIAEAEHCSEQTAEAHLATALKNRSRADFYPRTEIRICSVGLGSNRVGTGGI